jgi:hypothetical protein
MTSSKKLKTTFTAKQWERFRKIKTGRIGSPLGEEFFEYRTTYGARLHRIDGPAYKDSYRTSWCIEGKLHREDDPAQIWVKPIPSEGYWLCGKKVTEQQFYLILAKRRLKAIL